MSDKANVLTKIAAAMAEIDMYAPKDGTNAFHKYQYTSIGQYIAHVRPALVKHGLVIIPKLIELIDYEDATTDAVMEYTIYDSKSGENVTATFTGRGQDATREGKRLDKGPYKAYSGAFKYFLSEVFMIASGDDPDERGNINTGQKVATKRQQRPKQQAPKPQNGSPDPMTQFWSTVKEKEVSLEQGRKILSDAGGDPELALDILTGTNQEPMPQ